MFNDRGGRLTVAAKLRLLKRDNTSKDQQLIGNILPLHNMKIECSIILQNLSIVSSKMHANRSVASEHRFALSYLPHSFYALDISRTSNLEITFPEKRHGYLNLHEQIV